MLKTLPWRMMGRGCAIGILAGLLVVAFESDFQGQICEYNHATKHEDCTPYGIFPFLLIKIGKTLNDYGVAITALATVAIGIFTLTLKLSTDRLWIAGEKQRNLFDETAKRQLRAYVHVADAAILYAEADSEWCPNIRVQFKNYGQTPAYKVRNRCKCTMSLIGQPDFDKLPEVITHSSDLGPTQDRITTVIIPRIHWEFMTANAIMKPVSGTVHVFGEITYFDAFQNRASAKPHFTRYRFYLVRDDDGITSLMLSDEGNESN
jgi:hypothetical protein